MEANASSMLRDTQSVPYVHKPENDWAVWAPEGMQSLRQGGGGVGIVSDVLNEKSGLRGGIGAIRASISTMYEDWEIYNFDWMGGVLMAHMAGAASVGDWDSALFGRNLFTL